ncbi:MAG: hypothetical protein GWN67_22590 [Phycisphaerae bacterium]|nr:hypothetical protein [Phycisphaerae bacterium]NIP54921.1 hypothetical protein [Phycisphaerae bacterium]NIS53656.1 hypothetical protein [Phycisphaerae bacterium]NIU11212.1 hypothetical protein [Phycisphaerae bacterium]NIU59067.1 hypothetical protein [Phycisphaerae bacterium]
MARNRGKMSLYEVIGKGKSKSGYGKKVKKLTPAMPEKQEPKAVTTAVPVTERATHWPRKPKLLQFNAGRVEISLPYPLAFTVFLGLILLFLVALWLGEKGYLNSNRITNSAGTVFNGLRKKVGQGFAGSGQRVEENENILPDDKNDNVKETVTIQSKGGNRIVIQTYHTREDLELVQYHFAEGNIETEIRKIGNTFYLVTVDRYEKDPKIAGTDGYAALQKIIKWGARYKAPQGYESFAPNLFSDAYGKKFDD